MMFGIVSHYYGVSWQDLQRWTPLELLCALDQVRKVEKLFKGGGKGGSGRKGQVIDTRAQAAEQTIAMLAQLGIKRKAKGNGGK